MIQNFSLNIEKYFTSDTVHFKNFLCSPSIETILGQWHDLFCNHSNGDRFTCSDNNVFSYIKMACFLTNSPGIYAVKIIII